MSNESADPDANTVPVLFTKHLTQKRKTYQDGSSMHKTNQPTTILYIFFNKGLLKTSRDRRKLVLLEIENRSVIDSMPIRSDTPEIQAGVELRFGSFFFFFVQFARSSPFNFRSSFGRNYRIALQ